MLECNCEYCKTKHIDIFIISFPVILCCFIFILNPSVKKLLILRIENYNLASYYLSNFLHFDSWHLLSNFFLYFVLVIPSYLLYRSVGSVYEFRVALGVSIFLSATFVSWTFLMFAKPGMRGFGFSGVAFSMFGLLFYSLARLLGNRYIIDSLLLYILFIAVGPLTKLDVVTWPPKIILYPLVGSIIAFFVYYLVKIFRMYRLRSDLYLLSISGKRRVFTFLLVLFDFYLYVRFFLVGVEISHINGVVVNNVAHIAGLVAGYMAPPIGHFIVYTLKIGHNSRE